ncbi:hypothetical protein Q3G72_014515 [Acer saccharum]|nr:hypothetical protein Q3G72_014515 [Acer saccharum]
MKIRRECGVDAFSLGFGKRGPLGCLPALTAQNSYQKCIPFFNSTARFHNLLLKHAVNKLNTDTDHNSAGRFIILDIYASFKSTLNKNHFKGKLKVKNPLEPCCVGLDGHSCGGVDEKGVKKYSVCKNPESFFFRDNVHPTQSGWHALHSSLKTSLHRIYKD